MNRKNTGPDIKVDVGLRAEATLNVKAEIPSSSVGRLIDTLTDIVRPFSEARGLKADFLRLQREEVAIKICQLARQKLLTEGGPIGPVPTKILVPLLEKGSYEDPGDIDMISRWANLLASAAQRKGVEPRYIGVLSELSGSQAQALEAIALNGNSEGVGFLHAATEIGPEYWIVDQIKDLITARFSVSGDASGFGDALFRIFNRPGGVVDVIDIAIDMDGEDGHSQWASEIEWRYDDLAILESLNLVRKVLIREERKLRAPRGKTAVIHIIYYYLTDAGANLYKLCRP